jgi:iron-sulfur cluster repair protein YtfE (RIC family)
MKRSTELAVLSREHHIALELALRLRRATTDQAHRLAADAIAFWHRESVEHFRLEEEVLLPSLACHAGNDDPDIERTLSDHAQLRVRFGRLEGGAVDTDALQALGEALADHVRFEERVLFPRVEAMLGPDELARVGQQLRPPS